MARSRNRSRNRSRANPSASDGLLVAGVALGTAGLVLWWASRSSEAEAASPPQTSQLPTAPSPARVRTAVLGERFRLRPTATTASVGTVYPATTRVVLLEDTRVRRGRGTLWRVRVPNGREGFAFVLPEEIQ